MVNSHIWYCFCPQMKLMVRFISIISLFFPFVLFAQFYSGAPASLHLDTSYSYFQFFSAKTGQQLTEVFQKANTDKAVIFHYGASHVQAEVLVTEARNALQGEFGDAGRGLVFNYGAANTYSSINYKSTSQGSWSYAKSFQLRPKLPLGVMGMTVQSEELLASLNWDFKTPLQDRKHLIWILADNDDWTPDFEVLINETSYTFDKENRSRFAGLPYYELEYEGEIDQVNIQLINPGDSGIRFTFYGMNFETVNATGLVYHSLGVGAAPMESVLRLNAMPAQAMALKPDLVFLDFGTNNILYTNRVDPKIRYTVARAVDSFRRLNPNVVIVLTTTQDLFYKGHIITAGVEFRDLMKNLAREYDCAFWNWYDISGGLGTIRQWGSDGYATSDNIHLTWKGYRLKGGFVHHSIMNSLRFLNENPGADSLVIASKIYDMPAPAPVTRSNSSSRRYHTVKSGESLWSISRKYNTTVEKIQKLNGLRGTLIRPGQRLRVR